MSARTWSFYDLADGRLLGRTFMGTDESLALNVPEGAGAVEGHWDHRTHRVDLGTLEAVRWRDPPPTRDHQWDEAASSWQPSRQAQRRTARDRIAELELRQLRPLRELSVDPHDRQARDRLAAIDAEIADLRAVLTRED